MFVRVVCMYICMYVGKEVSKACDKNSSFECKYIKRQTSFYLL